MLSGCAFLFFLCTYPPLKNVSPFSAADGDNGDMSLLSQARSLSPIDIDDLVLVDKLKDVGRVHEDADGADGGDQEEYPELGTVHHHCHKLPVFSYLQAGKF
jgi:hypothetical protein